MIDRLVRALDGGLGREEVDAELIRDLLWLLLQAGLAPDEAGKAPADPSRRWALPGGRRQPDGAEHPRPDGTSSERQGPQAGGEQASVEILDRSQARAGAGGAVTPRAATWPAPDIRAASLAQACRPMRRARRLSRRTEIDEDATACATADTGVVFPVLRRVPEPRFTVDLVVDEGLSTSLWSHELQELERGLRISGAFRAVRRSPLTDPTELTDPSRSVATLPTDSLVVVATDAIGRYWHRPETWRAIAQWAGLTPTWILQLLPEGLWARTGVGQNRVRLHASGPLRSNADLVPSVPVSRRLTGQAPDGITVPVVRLTAEAVAEVAAVTGSGSPAGCLGVSIEDVIAQLSPPPTRIAEHEAVESFRQTASQPALRLAVLLSVSPACDVRIARVLMKELVPEATTADLAEVLLSGMLSPLEPGLPGMATGFRFRDGCRESLRTMLSSADAWQVYRAIGRAFTDERHDGPAFGVLMRDPEGTLTAPAGLRPLLLIARDALDASGYLVEPPAPQPPPAQPEEPGDPPVVWGNVPQRNKNFTGRDRELLALRQQLVGDGTSRGLAVLHGMGGVGKSQLAAEYAHQYGGEYDLVWWVPASDPSQARASLAALAPRLGLDFLRAEIEDAVAAVLDHMRRGEPFARWLLVFDSADQPEDIRDLLPEGPGHVIVTSRNHRWSDVVALTGVDVLSRAEAVAFVRRRIPGVASTAAERLAEELGDLPLALEQAAALIAEGGTTVDEYLQLLAEEMSRVLPESLPAAYPSSVVAAWSLSVSRLREEMPAAGHLLELLAFFGAEPVPRALLKRGRYVLGPPLQSVVGDPIVLGQASRELGRYALARVENFHRTLQVHRLVQRLVRDDLDGARSVELRHAVHLLLAASDPDAPDNIDNWPAYDGLLAHLGPAEAHECKTPDVRRLVRNAVRYLYNRGDLATGDAMAKQALARWRADSRPDDLDVLRLSAVRADILWARGSHEGAYELRRQTVTQLETLLGPESEDTLRVKVGLAADLRVRGDYADALALDQRGLERHRRVFGADDPRTFEVAHNLAVDHVLVGHYETAREADARLHSDRLRFHGRDDHPAVIASRAAMARDLRLSGQYSEALSVAQRAHDQFSDLVRQRILPPHHPWVLRQANDLSVVLRRMARFDEAVTLGEQTYEAARVSYGEDHPDTLAVAMDLGNTLRIAGDTALDDERLQRGGGMVEMAYTHLRNRYGPTHPVALVGAANHALTLARLGDPMSSQVLLEEARSGLRDRLGHRHPYALACTVNLATSYAGSGDPDRARRLGEQARSELRVVLGSDHPHTLACAANLAVDLLALGETAAAEALAADTVSVYRSILPANHPDVGDARTRRRILIDLDSLPF